MAIRSVTGSTVAEEMRRTVLDRAGLRSTFMGAAESSTAADLTRFGLSLFEGGLLNETGLAAMRNFQSVDILGNEHWAHSGGLKTTAGSAPDPPLRALTARRRSPTATGLGGLTTIRERTA